MNSALNQNNIIMEAAIKDWNMRVRIYLGIKMNALGYLLLELSGNSWEDVSLDAQSLYYSN